VTTVKSTLVWKAAVFALASPTRYRDLGVAYVLSRNLDGSNQHFADRYNSDETYRGEVTQTFAKQAAADARSLRARILLSLGITAGVLLIAFMIGWVRGAVNLTLPIDCLRACNVLGSALVGWATLFGLGTSKPVWDGNALPDLVGPVIFRILFVPGLVLALVGALG
jgi:hypothetical protein